MRVPETPERLRVALLDSIPVWGGGQKWMLTTAQALTRRGHFAAVACAAGSVLEQRALEVGLPVWAAPVGRFGWRFGSSLSLARFLRRERIECVIGNVGRDLRLGVLACAHVRRTPACSAAASCAPCAATRGTAGSTAARCAA